jgi:hypothetical protein
MDQITPRGNPNWKPGVSGNANGRPPGIADARHRFTAAFMTDLADSWRENGAEVLARVAKTSPEAYFSVCARLCPANVALTIQTQLPGGLSADDLAVLRAIRDSVPDANNRSPQDVLEYVRDAIRAHGAKTIEIA